MENPFCIYHLSQSKYVKKKKNHLPSSLVMLFHCCNKREMEFNHCFIKYFCDCFKNLMSMY